MIVCCTATARAKGKERAIQREQLCRNGIRRRTGSGKGGVVRVLRAPCVALLLALPAGCGEREAPPPGGEAAGRASGAVGPGADTLAARPRTDESRDVPAVPDTGWTVGRLESTHGAHAVQQELRTAQHDGFDRLVLDFGDGPLPGYRVEYIEAPVTACGSGEAVELPGAGWLSITLTPASAHDEEGRATVSNRDRVLDLPTILRVRSTCDFEGMVTWVAAVRVQRPFRVLELGGPARLVIDVRH